MDSTVEDAVVLLAEKRDLLDCYRGVTREMRKRLEPPADTEGIVPLIKNRHGLINRIERIDKKINGIGYRNIIRAAEIRGDAGRVKPILADIGELITSLSAIDSECIHLTRTVRNGIKEELLSLGRKRRRSKEYLRPDAAPIKFMDKRVA